VGLDDQGINPGVGTRFSAPVQTAPGAPASCTTGFLQGRKMAESGHLSRVIFWEPGFEL
jgi:hypothetical protein